MANLEQIQQEAKNRGLMPSSDLMDRINSEMQRRGMEQTQNIPQPEVLKAGKAPPVTIQPNETTVKALQTGVDPYTGAPASIRAKAAFAGDERATIDALQKNLTEYYHQHGYKGNVNVRVGPDTGQLEYFNPQEGKYSLVNPVGVDIGDIASLSGPAMVAIPDVAATIGVSIYTLNPVAGISAGSAGAFAGEYARLKIGQAMGLNEHMSEADLMKMAAKQAGWSALGGTAGYMAARIAKGVTNLLMGRTALKSAGKLSAKDLDEAAETAREINAKIGSGRLKYTTGQAADDPDFLALEESFRKTRNFGAVSEFRDFDRQQAQALQDFWANINQPYITTRGKADTGRMIQRVVAQKQATGRAAMEARVGQAQTDVQNSINALPSRPMEETGDVIRKRIIQEQDDFNAWVKARAAELDQAADRPVIRNQATAEAAAKLDKEVKDSLLKNLQGQKRKLIGNKEGAPIPENVRQLRASVTGQAQPEYEPSKLFDPNATFTFGQYWDAVSTLDRMIRIGQKGLTADTPDVGALKLLKGALEKDAARSLEGTPLGEAFDTFRQAVRTQKDRLDRSMVADLVGQDERVLKVPTEKIFQTAFKNSDERDAAILAEILQKDPQAAQAWREGIYDMYKRTVSPDGNVDLAKHKKFMATYGRKLALFFPDTDIKQLEKVGGLQARVDELMQRREATFKALDKTLSGELDSLRPKSLFNRLWGTDPDPSEIHKAMIILKRDPEVLRAFKGEVSRDMGQRITSRVHQEPELSFKKLDTYLYGSGPEGTGGRIEALRELFGDKYVQGIETLHNALRIAQREAVAPNRSNTASAAEALRDVARAWTGLFTTAGRMLTAASRLKSRAANRALLNAMLDPDKMILMQELATLKPGSQRAAMIFGQLNALDLNQEGQ